MLQQRTPTAYRRNWRNDSCYCSRADACSAASFAGLGRVRVRVKARARVGVRVGVRVRIRVRIKVRVKVRVRVSRELRGPGQERHDVRQRLRGAPARER